MSDWYEESIEPEIRPVVKLLRNNGFNTTCSCEHTATVEMESYDDTEVTRLAELLIGNRYRDFTIRLNLWVTDDLRWVRTLNLEMMGPTIEDLQRCRR